MRHQTPFIQILTTTSSQEEARRVAHSLLGQRLAACVQILGPVESHYWWQGVVESGQEWLCVIKTHRRLFELVARCIRQLHSYDTPEIIAVPVVAGDERYLQWLRETLPDEDAGPGRDPALPCA